MSVPGLDLDRLAPWFRERVAQVDALGAEVIGHGRSNITYRLDALREPQGEAGDEHWVLRRPPLSHVQPTAHDMAREFRVISALAETEVPVPRAYALCEDGDVIGAPFYIMEYVAGLVPVNPDEVKRRFDESDRRRIGEELIDTLAELHALDPAQVGLGDFGRPQGYVERQVRRFTEQLARVKTRGLPELEELARRLPAAIPEGAAAAIVHGDYRLDNTILNDAGHIAAILDWEMSTLGDPLADLGALRMFWIPTARIGAGGVITLPGFPRWEDIAARYAERSGRDLSHLDFYIVLAHFRMAVILENMHARFLAGGTVGAGFELIGEQVPALARGGLAIADQSTIPALRG